MKHSPFTLTGIIVSVCLICSGGCAHIQLQKNSVRQAGTVSDIYEQQVLDNLARFAVNPYATPSFSVASQSTNGVSDHGEFGISDGGFKGKFFAFLSAGGSRDAEQNFTLDPVANPQRLQLMQCAYQRAIGLQIDGCDKCCEYLTAWTGREDACWDACGITSGWLCKSDCWKDVPKCCCERYGEYCGTYVWVNPCYRNEFSRLVMTIIEYAAGDPAENLENVRVTYYFGKDGLPTEEGTQVRAIEAIVPRTAMNEQMFAEIAELERELIEKETTLKEAENVFKNEKENMANVKETVSKIRKAFPDLALKETESQMIANVNAPDGDVTVSAQLEQNINSLRYRLQAKRSAVAIPSSASRINFGTPAGSKGQFQSDILRERQLLNTVPGR